MLFDENTKPEQGQIDEISGRLQGNHQASTIVSIMTLTLLDAPHGPNLVGTIGEIHGTGTIFPIFIADDIFN